MRRPNYQYYHNTATSFYTPQSTRRTPTQRHNFSMTQRQIHNKVNKQIVDLDFTCPLKGEQNPQVYFDKSKRKIFIKGLIDGYFKPPSSMLQFYDQSDSIVKNKKSSRSKNVYSSDCAKRKVKKQLDLKETVKNKILEFNISSLKDIERLPTINEGEFAHRPVSEYHLKRKIQKRPSSPFSSFIGSVSSNLSDSVYDEKSLIGSKLQLKQKEKNVSKASKLYLKPSDKKNRVFQTLDDERLIRQKFIKKMGLPAMWNFTSRETVLEYSVIKKTLRQMCYSIVQDKKGDQPLFLIFPTDYYRSLFTNNCQELIDIVKAMCKIVASGKGEISNNQIHMNNVHKIEQKNFQLYDWGCAGIRQTLVVQEISYPKIYQPNVRKNQQWLLNPEYLAPQLLRAIEYNSYEHLWSQKGGVSSCDVWSIGCLLFQLITLIPISQLYHCVIKGQKYSRRGLIGTKIKTVQNIIAKQKYFRSLVLRRIKDLIQEKQVPSINVKLLNLLPKILQQNPSKRITVTQIISVLS